MLKAYDFIEKKPNIPEIQNRELFNKEKSIALQYVLKHPMKNPDTRCPICGCNHTKVLFNRWDVKYYYCNECDSIYVPAEKENVIGYLNNSELIKLRISEEYQNEAINRRTFMWEERISWMKYRTYRYLCSNKNLDVIDYGNRYVGFIRKIKESEMIHNYDLRNSIINIKSDNVKKADAVMYMDQLQHETEPVLTLLKIKEDLKKNGILILNTRLGSGFDILTLKGNMESLFPYEHMMLPSKKGLEILLEKTGFELLEFTTPGSRDVDEVVKHSSLVEANNLFVKTLIENADDIILADFQRFLQKSGLSSFAQVIAKVKD